MKLSRKEELLQLVQHDLSMLSDDVKELIKHSDPLEALAFNYLKQSIERIQNDYSDVTAAIHQHNNQDLNDV